MGRAGYHGAHTKIFISEDGTVWEEGSERARPSRRWANDNIQVEDEQRGPRQNQKEHEYRILAVYAEFLLHSTARKARSQSAEFTLSKNPGFRRCDRVDQQ